jgi:hypothetical protein
MSLGDRTRRGLLPFEPIAYTVIVGYYPIGLG